MLDRDQIKSYLKNTFNKEIEFRHVQSLCSSFILPNYGTKDDPKVLLSDLKRFQYVLNSLSDAPGDAYFSEDLFSFGVPEEINLNDVARLQLPTEIGGIDPVYYAAVRNLVKFCESQSYEFGYKDISIPYFLESSVLTSQRSVEEFISLQQARFNNQNNENQSHFSSSAHYMGSKRLLGGYLVEALSGLLDEDALVLDLMCGSGACSASFNRTWETYSSDALNFCRILAKAKGGGYSLERASEVISIIMKSAREHAHILYEVLNEALDDEDYVFHGNLDNESFLKYKEFVSSFSIYGEGKSIKYQWNSDEEVRKRKDSKMNTQPYCLFICYFTNVYFGLRQCVEIDSLRYAINGLENEDDRIWSLAALITTLSTTGSTYGSHFAQPYIKDYDELSLGRFGKLIEKRSRSIFHEFSKRFLNISQESTKEKNIVKILPGPWQEALKQFTQISGNKVSAVYLDAPYKREEYSRYYHLLETMVKYDYPSCIGIGRVPDRFKNELFQSEFFTRNIEKLNKIFAGLIVEVLRAGHYCLWSYSDNGDASIEEVIRLVQLEMDSIVSSLAAPYSHQAQGGARTKYVTEYLVIFEPNVGIESNT